MKTIKAILLTASIFNTAHADDCAVRNKDTGAYEGYPIAKIYPSLELSEYYRNRMSNPSLFESVCWSDSDAVNVRVDKYAIWDLTVGEWWIKGNTDFLVFDNEKEAEINIRIAKFYMRTHEFEVRKLSANQE